jgi:uncharacterized protein (TIGR03437 family)
LPFNLSGTVTMVITTPNGSTDPIPLDIAETAPGIFSSAVVHNDGTLVSASASALPGEYLSIYLTGLGRVNSGILAGQPAPSGPLANALAPVQVQFGGTLVNPYFAGLAPGFAGLYQVVFQVPPVADGNYSVKIAARGVASNAISVPVGDVLGIGQNLAGVRLKDVLGNAVPA